MSQQHAQEQSHPPSAAPMTAETKVTVPDKTASPLTDDIVRRKKVRARARAILRTATMAMRAVHEMQAELEDKKKALRDMRAVAARSREDQATLASELVKLQLRQLVAQRALGPVSTSAGAASEKRSAESAQASKTATRMKAHARGVGDMHFGVLGGGGSTTATSATAVCSLKSSQHADCLGLYELCRDKPLVQGRPVYCLHHDGDGPSDPHFMFQSEHQYWRIGTDPQDPFSGWWRVKSTARLPSEIRANNDGTQGWEVYDDVEGGWVPVGEVMVEPAARTRGRRTSSVARETIPSPRFLHTRTTSFEQMEPSQQDSGQPESTAAEPTVRSPPCSPSKRGSHCPKCGTPYEPAYAFCTMCGYGFPTAPDLGH